MAKVLTFQKMNNTPQKIADKLIQLFPDFEKEWDEGESFGYEDGDYSFHVVFMEFAPVAHQMLSKASENQVKLFCTIINEMVANGGEEENAISTSLLEHASQVGIRKIIKPYLSQEAKKEIR